MPMPKAYEQIIDTNIPDRKVPGYEHSAEKNRQKTNSMSFAGFLSKFKFYGILRLSGN
jgi:hypothetical protein